MNGRIDVVRWIALVGAAMSLGCASSKPASESGLALSHQTITREQAGRAAYDVLSAMHFTFEKLDVEQGVIITRPLRGAQWFEFWRSDNVGGFNTAEANLQSIRRTVELRVKDQQGSDQPQTGGTYSIQSTKSGLYIECAVQVQRLALPSNAVAGTSQAYLMHTRSESTIQTLDVTPQQKAQMAWIDLGPDPDLAAEIVKRIEKRLQH
ncbi:MAG: hypothetical protein ACM3VT_19675 [Solirubrobacterales bacterium]